MNKPVAIIPARGGSERIPKKNITPLLGRPLISYPILACLESQAFEKVIVSTENDEIASVAKEYGAEVYYRPPELADAHAAIHSVLPSVLQVLESKEKVLPKYFCLVYATAVLLEGRHFTESYNVLTSEQYNFVMAVRKYRTHPYKALEFSNDKLTPVFKDKYLMRTQDFPEYYAPAGAFQWMNTELFLNGTNIWDQPRYPYELEPYTAIDVDDHNDLEIASRLLLAKESLSARKI